MLLIYYLLFSGYGRFGNVRENLLLSKQHFAPFVLYNEGAVDDMVRGLSSQSSQKFDRFFSKEVSQYGRNLMYLVCCLLVKIIFDITGVTYMN